jgi:hypothetical protein
MTVLDYRCPYCDAAMRTVAMECPLCEVEVRAAFRASIFDRLRPDELDLLEQYLLVDFNLKKLSERTGLGYMALRSRVDRLIAHYRELLSQEDEKKQILNQLDQGELSVDDAVSRIAALDGN